MKHHLVNLYKVCSNYGPAAKNGPVLRSLILHLKAYTCIYKKKHKRNSCLESQGLEPGSVYCILYAGNHNL